MPSDTQPLTSSPSDRSSALRPPGAAVRGQWSAVLPLATFSILWIDLCRLLSTQWEAREQYAYGWFVPFFAAALLWRRWQDRPQTTVHGPQSTVHGPQSGFLLSAFCLLLLFLLLPLRVIYEINRDWPLISWLYTGIVVFLTLYAIHLAGPRSVVSGQWSVVSPWVLHFAFPVCFILAAVAWPYRIEKGLTQGLMRVVAALTAELLGWLNIPAVQHGNVIELATGTVGIDEACSGIRSFQSSLMAALLMGELYRLRMLPRAVLAGTGLSLAFCFNIARTFLLSYQANKEGMSAIDKWHDPAGFTITVACFLSLWAIAVLAAKRWSVKRPEVRSQKSEVSLASDLRPLTSGADAALPSFPSVTSPEPQVSGFRFHPSARAFMCAVGAWALLAIGATEAWYRSHAIKDLGIFHWSVALPETKPGFEKIELPTRSQKLLAFDFGATGRWLEDGGSEWTLYFFRWNPNSVRSIIQSRNHRPDVCLPAAGLRQVSESQLEFFEAGGLKLPFRSYVYEAQGRTLYVFFCQWEDGAEHQTGLEASKQAGRLQSVLTGRRLLGQQTLEVIITGCDSLESAKDKFRQELPLLVSRGEAKQEL